MRRRPRAGELDNQQLGERDDSGQALAALRPDGSAQAVTSPYDGGSGRAVRPLCAGADGTLYAAAEGPRLVARSPDGSWRGVTAEVGTQDHLQPGHDAHQGDGGPAVEATVTDARDCAVEADGDLLVAEVCAVRRIDLDGVDGRVWLGSPLAVRTLEPQPDGSYLIDTVQSVSEGEKQGVDWPHQLTGTTTVEDLQPLPDGRVVVVASGELWVLGSDGVLRASGLNAASTSAVGLDAGAGLLYTAGPLADAGISGLRASAVP